MSKQYEPLNHTPLAEQASHVKPSTLPELAHIDDTAISMMIDFSQQVPVTISKNQTIDHAMLEMKSNDIHMLLVTDEQEHILGLISSRAIHGEKPYKIMQEKRIKHDQITVEMVMLKREKMLCVPFSEIEHAKLGNIIQTIQNAKRMYLFTVETNESDQQMLRGYFSISILSKCLGMDMSSTQSVAGSVAELQKTLKDFE